MKKIDLKNDWQVKFEGLHRGPEMLPLVVSSNDGWMSTGLPCDVHMPLLENGLIKEPLEADHYRQSRWVEDKSWWFKRVFSIHKESLESDRLELTLEALDCEADIFLNGFHLAHHKSAFYPFTGDVKEFLKEGRNELVVRVTSGLEHVSEKDMSAFKKSINTEQDNDASSDRGDKRRACVRKPQFVYGWDWAPRVATCGIMGDVYIKACNKLAVKAVYVVTENIGENAELELKIEVENFLLYSTIDALLKVEILFGDEKVIQLEREVFLRSGLNYHNFSAVIKDARLWWPNGMGDQPLYSVRVSASSGDVCTEYPEFKYGLRTVRLNMDKINDTERLFAFEINGVKTYCKGGNWVPADSIYARVTDEKYEILLREAREANFTMLRVWGGGIYERGIFYEKCDEYGLLIWQDFMFACSPYPDNLESFRNEVEKELDYQTRRLRNHPSVVLWCGNNENHWAFDEWWTGDTRLPFPGGSAIYNEIAPRTVERNCPEIPYWNSSPYGGEHPNGTDAGDKHHWVDCTFNPVVGKRITPEEYDLVKAKFISEYGYIGPCRKSSIIKYHGGAALDLNGYVWKLHVNTGENQILPAGIAKHYAEPDKLDLDQYLIYAGLCQGLMYGYSLEAIRSKEYNWGSLFWMYNDCWGEVGWTIIDYYLKRKPSYYFVKRAFAAKKLIMRQKDGIISVTGINDTPEVVRFEAVYGYVRFDGEEREYHKKTVMLQPFSRGAVLEFKNKGYDFSKGVCHISPLDPGCGILPAILRPGDFRTLDVKKANVKAGSLRHEGGDLIFTVSTDIFAHAVNFNLSDEYPLSDEYFDLLPGESREVRLLGAAGRSASIEVKPVSVY